MGATTAGAVTAIAGLICLGLVTGTGFGAIAGAAGVGALMPAGRRPDDGVVGAVSFAGCSPIAPGNGSGAAVLTSTWAV